MGACVSREDLLECSSDEEQSEGLAVDSRLIQSKYRALQRRGDYEIDPNNPDELLACLIANYKLLNNNIQKRKSTRRTNL